MMAAAATGRARMRKVTMTATGLPGKPMKETGRP